MLREELPSAFVKNIVAQLGSEADAFFAAYARPHYRALRLVPRLGLDGTKSTALGLDASKTSIEAAARLASGFTGETVPWQNCAYRVREETQPGSSLLHLLGLYYMQEPSAMAAAAALDVRPGMKVLDLCAAPGGKSGQLALALAGKGLLVSNEPIPNRAKMLAGNIERQGFSNVIVTNEYPDRLAESWKNTFDAILVDAPCSGEGMFRRDAGAVAEWSEDAPRMCHERQLTILESAYAMLRAGGMLVYSTCTFNRTENEGTIEAFTLRHPDMLREDFTLAGIGTSGGGMLRLWPHKIEGEGHFVCRLRKMDETDTRVPKSKRTGKNLKNGQEAAQKALRDLTKEIDLPSMPGTPKLFGSHLYLLPEGAPDTDGITVCRAGLELCEVGRSHVEPAYALCRALAPNMDSVALSTEETIAVVRGNMQLTHAAGKGWHMLTWQGLPVCMGKSSDGVIKVHYPKGLIPTGRIWEEQNES